MEQIDLTKEVVEVKVCPKCGREYDASWGQCIRCSVPLVVKDKEVEPVRNPESGEIACPNPMCTYVGEPDREKRRSTFVAVLMLLAGFIPWLIYNHVSKGYTYRCPKCGSTIDVEKLIGKSNKWDIFEPNKEPEGLYSGGEFKEIKKKEHSKPETSGRGVWRKLLVVFGVIALMIFGFVVWVLLLPQQGVLLNNEVEEYALEYMEKNEILNGTEKLVAYYDKSFLVNGTESAILTSERVIYDKEGRTTFIELMDIENVKHGKGDWGEDIVEIVSVTGEKMRIEIEYDQRGELFYRTLLQLKKKAAEVRKRSH